MRFVESLLQDLRFSFRTMRKAPLVSAVAVLSLTLGIGANVAIFTVIDALLLRSLPVKNPNQIVILSWLAKNSSNQSDWTFSIPMFEQLRRRVPVTGFSYFDGFRVIAGGRAEYARGEAVSGNYHALLGIKPAAGRLLVEEDDRDSSAPVCVLGNRFWQSHFGGDRSAVGQKLVVGNVQVTIVGVEPAEFVGLMPGYAPALRVPLHLITQISPELAALFLDPGNEGLELAARIPKETLAQTRRELNVLFRQNLPPDRQNRELVVEPGGGGIDSFRSQFRDPLLLLMAAVGVVLLIASANVANLLLARAKVRERETAVRLALGAGRLRLARQWLTESLLLSMIGAALGVCLAYWASGLLASFYGLAIDVRPEARVVAFTATLTSLTGILFGLAPAVQAMRANLQPSLQRHPASRFGLASGLVVLQLALTLLTVAGAGLYLRTLHNLRGADLGIEVRGLSLFRVYPRSAGYDTSEQAARLSQRILERLQTMPVVESAALSRSVPLQSGLRTTTVEVPGLSLPVDSRRHKVSMNQVTSRFFETMGIPVLLGRGLGGRDPAAAVPAAVINETLARAWFANESPVGKHFRQNNRDFEIVGVVRDSRDVRVTAVLPTFFVDYLPSLAADGFAVEIRTRGRRRSIAEDVRRAMAEIDPGMPLRDLATAEETIDFETRRNRLLADLSSLFGGLALLLAAIGLYAVRAYAVARRSLEIGIRVALGADPRAIQGMIVRETGLLVLLGVSLGLAAAYSAARYIRSMLFGVEARDFPTFVCAAMVTIFVALLAGYLPARRAAGVDPMVAIRHE
jgi:predicted permease